MELRKNLTVNSRSKCRRTGTATCYSFAVIDNYSDVSTCQDLSDAFPIQNNLKEVCINAIVFLLSNMLLGRYKKLKGS